MKVIRLYLSQLIESIDRTAPTEDQIVTLTQSSSVPFIPDLVEIMYEIMLDEGPDGTARALGKDILEMENLQNPSLSHVRACVSAIYLMTTLGLHENFDDDAEYLVRWNMVLILLQRHLECHDISARHLTPFFRIVSRKSRVWQSANRLFSVYNSRKPLPADVENIRLESESRILKEFGVQISGQN